jgi:hypothetical protein
LSGVVVAQLLMRDERGAQPGRPGCGLWARSPPASWPDDRYDLVWTLSPTEAGWSFHQVPELLLDGDSKQEA